MPKKVLVTDYVWPSVDPEREVLGQADIELVVAPNGDEKTLADLAQDVDGILTCFAKVTENVVKSAQKCVVISRYGVGVDNIAVETSTEHGILVTYVPDYCVDEVSDHIMALILSWNRRIVLFDKDTKTNGWGNAGLGMRIMRLRGKKIGVVGFGRIGRAVASKASAFGLEILAYDPMLTADAVAEHGATMVELHTLLTESDFITLHSPLNPSTRNMIGKDELGLMKPEAFLINAARGGLIEENALYNSLISKQIAGAGLDVVEDIAPELNHRILQLDNVIVTPHTAFFSQEAVLELEQRAAQEVVRALTGQMPENLINKEVLNKPNLRANLEA